MWCVNHGWQSVRQIHSLSRLLSQQLAPGSGSSCPKTLTFFLRKTESFRPLTAFAVTFDQLYDDRDTDEFEFNWRQPFPFKEFEEFKKRIN